MIKSFLNTCQLSQAKSNADDDDDSEDGASQILDDIHEALDMARLQGKITPVRIARILAGEGTEQFSAGLSTGARKSPGQQTVPLSVALEYVGAILDESRKEIARLKVRDAVLPLSADVLFVFDRAAPTYSHISSLL